MYNTGSSNSFWDGTSSQPSTENDASGFDSTSSSEYTHTSQSSSGTSSSYRTPSEPIPGTYSSTSRRSTRVHEYFNDRTNGENDRRPRRSKKCRRQSKDQGKFEKVAESWGIRLFHCHKKDKDYTGAEKLYQEIMEGRDPTENEDILELNHSFAAMLVDQGKFQDAEPISMTVWKKREEDTGPPSDSSKESHRQLCSILCAVGKHKDAENMQRSMYQSGIMDAWTLENGDEVCQRLREQRDFKKAKDMQGEVWETRLNHNGPRDDLIKSGWRLIGDLEELVAAIDIQGGDDVERRFRISHKQTLECEIELTLRKIWDPRPQPELTTDVLNAGHKLGMVVFCQNRFADAEAIFTPVWEGKKRHRQLGDRDASTISTGSMLGKTLCRQGDQESYRRAVDILPDIWRTMMNGDPEAISTGEDLALAYHSMSDWLNAETVYRWIVQQKIYTRCPTWEIEDARWLLAKTLYKQATNKHREAQTILGLLYRQWNASSPDSNKTLECGFMLAQLLSTQPERAEEAQRVALDVFGRRASMERGLAYLQLGHLCGSLLEKDEKLEDAESILRSIWGDQAVVPEEQKVRLSCGHLIGRMLAKRRKYSEAKKILEEVLEAQEAESAGILEQTETRRLLEEVNKLKKGKEKAKRNSGRWAVTIAKKR